MRPPAPMAAMMTWLPSEGRVTVASKLLPLTGTACLAPLTERYAKLLNRSPNQ